MSSKKQKKIIISELKPFLKPQDNQQRVIIQPAQGKQQIEPSIETAPVVQDELLGVLDKISNIEQTSMIMKGPIMIQELLTALGELPKALSRYEKSIVKYSTYYRFFYQGHLYQSVDKVELLNFVLVFFFKSEYFSIQQGEFKQLKLMPISQAAVDMFKTNLMEYYQYHAEHVRVRMESTSLLLQRLDIAFIDTNFNAQQLIKCWIHWQVDYEFTHEQLLVCKQHLPKIFVGKNLAKDILLLRQYNVFKDAQFIDLSRRDPCHLALQLPLLTYNDSHPSSELKELRKKFQNKGPFRDLYIWQQAIDYKWCNNQQQPTIVFSGCDQLHSLSTDQWGDSYPVQAACQPLDAPSLLDLDSLERLVARYTIDTIQFRNGVLSYVDANCSADTLYFAGFYDKPQVAITTKSSFLMQVIDDNNLVGISFIDYGLKLPGHLHYNPNLALENNNNIITKVQGQEEIVTFVWAPSQPIIANPNKKIFFEDIEGVPIQDLCSRPKCDGYRCRFIHVSEVDELAELQPAQRRIALQQCFNFQIQDQGISGQLRKTLLNQYNSTNNLMILTSIYLILIDQFTEDDFTHLPDYIIEDLAYFYYPDDAKDCQNIDSLIDLFFPDDLLAEYGNNVSDKDDSVQYEGLEMVKEEDQDDEDSQESDEDQPSSDGQLAITHPQTKVEKSISFDGKMLTLSKTVQQYLNGIWYKFEMVKEVHFKNYDGQPAFQISAQRAVQEQLDQDLLSMVPKQDQTQISESIAIQPQSSEINLVEKQVDLDFDNSLHGKAVSYEQGITMVFQPTEQQIKEQEQILASINRKQVESTKLIKSQAIINHKAIPQANVAVVSTPTEQQIQEKKQTLAESTTLIEPQAIVNHDKLDKVDQEVIKELAPPEHLIDIKPKNLELIPAVSTFWHISNVVNLDEKIFDWSERKRTSTKGLVHVPLDAVKSMDYYLEHSFYEDIVIIDQHNSTYYIPSSDKGYCQVRSLLLMLQTDTMHVKHVFIDTTQPNNLPVECDNTIQAERMLANIVKRLMNEIDYFFHIKIDPFACNKINAQKIDQALLFFQPQWQNFPKALRNNCDLQIKVGQDQFHCIRKTNRIHHYPVSPVNGSVLEFFMNTYIEVQQLRDYPTVFDIKNPQKGKFPEVIVLNGDQLVPIDSVFKDKDNSWKVDGTKLDLFSQSQFSPLDIAKNYHIDDVLDQYISRNLLEYTIKQDDVLQIEASVDWRKYCPFTNGSLRTMINDVNMKQQHVEPKKEEIKQPPVINQVPAHCQKGVPPVQSHVQTVPIIQEEVIETFCAQVTSTFYYSGALATLNFPTIIGINLYNQDQIATYEYQGQVQSLEFASWATPEKGCPLKVRRHGLELTYIVNTYQQINVSHFHVTAHISNEPVKTLSAYKQFLINSGAQLLQTLNCWTEKTLTLENFLVSRVENLAFNVVTGKDKCPINANLNHMDIKDAANQSIVLQQIQSQIFKPTNQAIPKTTISQWLYRRISSQYYLYQPFIQWDMIKIDFDIPYNRIQQVLIALQGASLLASGYNASWEFGFLSLILIHALLAYYYYSGFGLLEQYGLFKDQQSPRNPLSHFKFDVDIMSQLRAQKWNQDSDVFIGGQRPDLLPQVEDIRGTNPIVKDFYPPGPVCPNYNSAVQSQNQLKLTTMPTKAGKAKWLLGSLTENSNQLWHSWFYPSFCKIKDKYMQAAFWGRHCATYLQPDEDVVQDLIQNLPILLPEIFKGVDCYGKVNQLQSTQFLDVQADYIDLLVDPKMKRLYQQEYDKFLITCRQKVSFYCFMKHFEQQVIAANGATKPRNIMCPDPKLVLIAAFSHKITKLLCSAIPELAYGLNLTTLEERLQMLVDRVQRGNPIPITIECQDGSSFDSHQQKWLRRAEQIIYEFMLQFFSITTLEREIISKYLSTLYIKKINFCQRLYGTARRIKRCEPVLLEGTTFSGDPFTSIGNSLRSLLYVRYTMFKAKVPQSQFSCAVQGDDTIIFICSLYHQQYRDQLKCLFMTKEPDYQLHFGLGQVLKASMVSRNFGQFLSKSIVFWHQKIYAYPYSVKLMLRGAFTDSQIPFDQINTAVSQGLIAENGLKNFYKNLGSMDQIIAGPDWTIAHAVLWARLAFLPHCSFSFKLSVQDRNKLNHMERLGPNQLLEIEHLYNSEARCMMFAPFNMRFVEKSCLGNDFGQQGTDYQLK